MNRTPLPKPAVDADAVVKEAMSRLGQPARRRFLRR